MREDANERINRRTFLAAVPAVASVPLLGRGLASTIPAGSAVGSSALGINGGTSAHNFSGYFLSGKSIL